MNLYRIKDEDKDTYYVVADNFGKAGETFNENSSSHAVTIKQIEEDITIQEEDK